MVHRISRTVAAALLTAALCAAPAYADDAHITPTDAPSGFTDGTVGDPLPEGMEHIDIDRQLADLEAESPQHGLIDPTPEPEQIIGGDPDMLSDVPMLDDMRGEIGTDDPDVVIEYLPAPAGEVGDQAWTAPTTAPTTAPVATPARPSLPSTGV